jgi:hypothetical protein
VVHQIESEIGDAQFQNRLFGITTPERVYAGDQFRHGKWLRQVIIRAQLQSSHAIFHFAARGEHQSASGNVAGPDSTQHLEAVDSRQTYIEYNQIKWRFKRAVHRSLAVVDRNRGVTGLSQRRGNPARQWKIIFDDKDAHEFKTAP